MKRKFAGLSLKRDKHFVRNLVICIGVVLVWRGVWHLADKYLFPNHPTLSDVMSIVIGVIILYLPDGTLEHLGGYRREGSEDETHVTNQK